MLKLDTFLVFFTTLLSAVIYHQCILRGGGSEFLEWKERKAEKEERKMAKKVAKEMKTASKTGIESEESRSCVELGDVERDSRDVRAAHY